MKFNVKTILLGLAAIGLTASATETTTSPSGRLVLTVDTDAEGTPVYSLTYDGRDVVTTSRLGITGDELELGKGMTIKKATKDTFDEYWEPVWGEYDRIRNNYNELAVEFAKTDDPEKGMTVRFRVFDDGLGFRYEFPIQGGTQVPFLTLRTENTEFAIPGNPTLFCSPGDYNTDEFLYTTTSLSDIADNLTRRRQRHTESNMMEGVAVQTPLMIKTEGQKPLYINLHEANLRNYGAMALSVDTTGTGAAFTAHIIPDKFNVAAYQKFPFNTPWRTIVVSDDARDILASNLIYNLNEPNALDDTSWIKPQKFMGVWWEMFLGRNTGWNYSDEFYAKPGETDYSQLTPNGRHPANNENVKRYIDFAAAHNIPALLVEGWNEGWEDWSSYNKNRQFLFTAPYPDFDVDSLQAYALSKGVRLIMHHETAANAADYERQLDEAFQFMKDHGYNSVKTGYVGSIIPRSEHHYSQWMVDHFLHVAQKAAEYGIMVDSHEAARPTGLSRTYPNWVAQENARGGEFESMGGNPPEHTVILPFTRLMGGPMDYTPGLFEPHPSHVSNGGTVEGGSTLAKQLALYLTMYSPLQMACDLPEHYERYLDAFQFIEDVPVDWSNTVYLEAEPGDYITVARKDKASNDWYIGGITDENARTANLDLSFLTPGVKYTATIYEDGADADYRTNPKSYNIRTVKNITSRTKLKIKLACGGGFAIRLIPNE